MASLSYLGDTVPVPPPSGSDSSPTFSSSMFFDLRYMSHGVDVFIGTEHSVIICSLHFDQLCFSAMISIFCKEMAD